MIVMSVSVKIDYLPRVNYAMMNSGIEVLNQLVLENLDDHDLHQVIVRISGEYIKECISGVELLRVGQPVHVLNVQIVPDISILSEITEAVNTSFRLTVMCCDDILYEKEYPISLLTYDQWAGSGIMPEHLAAFVVPNNPYLPRIKLNAAGYLEKWTGSSSFNEYQTQDRNRVRAQVAAIYHALRDEGIIYSAPPASFEQTGQRIRLADKVLEDKTGTCIDTSLLIASCLEEAGIYPLIIMLYGHAMVGAWLTPNVFPQMVCDDASYLLKEMADGNNNIVLLESTAITSTENISFEEAVLKATVKVRDENSFRYFVDIHRCRLGNIRPLPQRVERDGKWIFVNEGLDHDNPIGDVISFNHYDLRLDDNDKPVTRQMVWERKLLDFSLRNNLINTRIGRRVIPFVSFEIDRIEDLLEKGEDFSITPFPDIKLYPNDDGMYDSVGQAQEYRAFVSEFIGSRKIVSYLTDYELQNALKHVYRTARTSIEENGANSLFLALGMLKWYENARSEQPRFAPILLLPVDIIRRSNNNYIIRKRDAEAILNITLVELLKQNFRINLDTRNVDVKVLFTYIRRAIAEQRRWNVMEEAMLGLFSFNKFVMWNDIHSNAEKLKENVIVASLMENRNRQESDEDPVDARIIDKENSPMDFAVPLDVDSSQMEAIVESGRGRSFILHGPPGTGKSQTITNMIANALYQGKRVLFVAEKMAALSVVQSRLEKINLAPFCLELHSNKATKKHFLEQMEAVLNVTKTNSAEDYARRSEELFNERKELISYMEALHHKTPNGLSLYDCINEYLSIPEEETREQLPPLEMFNDSYITLCREQVEQIDTVLEIVGQPNENPLFGLEPKDNRPETLDSIVTLLKDFMSSYRQFEASKVQDWQDINDRYFITRYFAKRRYLKSLLNMNRELDDMADRLNGLMLNDITRDDIISHADVWSDNFHLVRDWCHWLRMKRCLAEIGAAPVVSMVEKGMRPVKAMNSFLKGLYHELIETIIKENEQLRMFNGIMFRQQIKKYRQNTARFRELSKEELYCRLASRVPSSLASVAEGSEISILKRNIANGGRANSIRSIIDSIPTLLTRLCPCVLMSPISVAQYLDMDSEKFDLVIFDEASQMPTSEAVGAIARGKALIVVGDRKQMPPTSFFMTNQVDDEEADIDDMENILDDCMTLSICEHQLNWHYRSKHESLIAFSNSQYYGNRLLTFPSADDHAVKVRLVPVNGVYDKGQTRCNAQESKAIVEEIIRRLSDAELQKLSIGVVAFSKVQGDLIEDDLYDELDRRPELKEIALNRPEPIFIKNLENVQGDERDVILFSIGYGTDKNGTVSMNFGPLNYEGGERRLNVAVSRARYEMIVFSSIRSGQIDLKRSNAKGVEGLKYFLEYAETGVLPFKSDVVRNYGTDVMANQICNALANEGYITDMQVGKSDFKVDIAVSTPDNPEQYILGILCDGRSYYETKTTRDREIVQPDVLKGLNWRTMRVYSIDWYENKERVMKQILAELESVKEEKNVSLNRD